MNEENWNSHLCLWRYGTDFFLPLDSKAGRALVTDRILFPFVKCETSFSATGWGHIAGAIGHNCMQMPFLSFPYLTAAGFGVPQTLLGLWVSLSLPRAASFFHWLTPKLSKPQLFNPPSVEDMLSVLGLLLKNQSSNQIVNPALRLLVCLFKERPQLSQEKQGRDMRVKQLLR